MIYKLMVPKEFHNGEVIYNIVYATSLTSFSNFIILWGIKNEASY